jgi:hypothetical protein
MLTDSNGNSTFQVHYFKAVWSSNLTFTLTVSNALDFIEAHITQQLQKELANFAGEIWDTYNSGGLGYDVIR